MENKVGGLGSWLAVGDKMNRSHPGRVRSHNIGLGDVPHMDRASGVHARPGKGGSEDLGTGLPDSELVRKAGHAEVLEEPEAGKQLAEDYPRGPARVGDHAEHTALARESVHRLHSPRRWHGRVAQDWGDVSLNDFLESLLS